jgi:hypothetical protein
MFRISARCSIASAAAICLAVDIAYSADAAIVVKETTTQYPTAEIGLDGSLPIQYSSNALSTANNPQGDFLVSPFLQLSLGGALSKDIGYSVYINGGTDVYSRITEADGSLSTHGAKITKKVDNWLFGASFDRNLFFDGMFREFLFVGNDFTAFAQYKFVAGSLTVKPTVSAGYRIADLSSQDRGLFSGKVDVEYTLTKMWAAVGTGRLRYYVFTEGTNDGRRDLLATGSAGLKYNISDDVTLTATVGFERRFSNVAIREYTNFTALSSLDFSYVLAKLK